MILDDIARRGVVPVIAPDVAAAARPRADAFADGGLTVAEIICRASAARNTIAAIRGAE